ncbi:MAG: type II secretion system protein GspE [Planctomycetaceae bacterium]|nr:MAG: type II secretion system protein GspE [Planctomycetaceae bacterium]
MVNQTQTMDNVVSIRVLDRLKQEMVKEGLITIENLRIAETTAQQEQNTLSSTLIKSGFLSEEELTSFIGKKTNIPYVNIRNYSIDRNVLALVSEKLARHYRIIPLFIIENVLTIAMADPLNIISMDDISKLVKCQIESVIASGESIDIAIDQWYGSGQAREKLIEELAEEIKQVEKRDDSKHIDQITEIHLKSQAAEKPIIKLVNSYIAQAMLEGASDIHLEPKKASMIVRFRIDGFLYEREPLPFKLIPPITSRIKVMSGLDITKRRVPQDGRMGLIIRDRNIDVRTSTFPSMYGENVVLRLLDKTKGVPTLSELGFSDGDFNVFKKMIRATKGIILATGPTGSGKTTTIYSAVGELNKEDKNVMTIEDPIEYEIEGIVQGQVDHQAGIIFPSALRSILRQDPDIIYVGEIRDFETAEIVVRAALTGHLVLSTLHTNDAIGTIMRLRDIGIESGLMEAVLRCSFAQRLVRKICPRCIKEYQPDESLLVNLGLPSGTRFYKGKGCGFCGGIGYRGRIGLFEILVINKDIRKLIADNASEEQIREAARAQGMQTLFQDGLKKVMEGITTIEEVKRVTEEEEQ